MVGLQGQNTLRPARELQPNEATYTNNVRVRSGNVVPCKTANAEAFGSQPDENIKHFVTYQLTDPYLILLGTTKVWVQQSGNPVAKTPATPFSATTKLWHGFTMLHSGAPVMIVNNRGIDVPHYWDGGAGLFIVVGNAPNARVFTGYLGRLFGGNVDVSGTWYPNRFKWSVDGNITDWTGTGSGWWDLKDEGDPIAAFAIVRSYIAFTLRRDSIYVLTPTSDPESPITDQPFARRGIIAPNSVQVLEQEFLFLGHDDVYMCNMSGLQRVGGRIRRDLFSGVDESKIDLAWSFVDKREKEYYLVTDMADSTLRGWIWNYEDNTWATQDLTGYTALTTWRKD